MTVPTEPATILVVDDAEANRYLLSSWLRRVGYRVTEASTGAEALSSLTGERPDLLLLDVNLPDMSGLDVCAQVKADPRTAVVPVIHVSATAVEPEDEARGLTGGADAYLLEPVDPRVLVATIEAVLRYYRAREVAERLAARLTELTRATHALNSATTFESLLAAAAAGAAAMFGGAATVLTSTPLGLVRAASTPAGEVTAGTEPAPPPAVEEITGTVQLPAVVTVDSVDWHGEGRATVFVSRPKPSAVPVCIAVDTAHASGDELRQLLLQLGQATTLACEGLRVRSEEHTRAVTLQRSLLPGENPTVPGLSIATRYVPATHDAEIGGDFYEVAELGDRVLVAVGDVVGHSLKAATVMGEIRHALRAYAIEGHDTVTILERLDALVRRFHPEWFTTMCVMLVDLAAGTAEVANAGHIPPLLSDAGGNRYLDVVGPLLGAGWRRPPASHVELPPGTLVLLVTDGIVERRNRNVDGGMVAIQNHVRPDADLETLCDSLLEHFGRDAEDDIALVAIRTTPPPGVL
ncbi:fused response regulator/phosphatase [Actinophytocola sp.]|uniref:fused response regulator/phosphatase n=1 Tax=Actinophytocola sp. TaxID=1872138 RepID=UPI002D22FDB5|nr:fused response regulator/phosphatase [Actinophytocola sp.]HYQ69235.1 fused response regulator/phosphatase [Actinophytocola sp.]